MPRGLWAPCGVATPDAIFSFGGAPSRGPYHPNRPPTDEIYRYRPNDGWTNLTATHDVRCPYPNWAMGGVFNPTDGLVYCVGGGTVASRRKSASNHGLRRPRPGTFDERRLWTFDPKRKRVVDSDVGRMPKAKRWPSVSLCEIDGRQYLYAICGLLGVTGPTASNFRFDIRRGNWERMKPAPLPGIYGTTSNPVVDGVVYLTHGLFWKGNPSVDSYATVCHRYDSRTDRFRTSLPEPCFRRGGTVDGVIDGTLYVAGGHIKRFDQNGYHDCQRYTEAFHP
ncbi:hypothetical protein [Haladaptatus sp. NG-WS-4]